MTIFASSGTITGIKALVKEFYVGANTIELHKQNDNFYHIHNGNGKIEGVAVEKIRGRWKFGTTTI